MNKPKPYHRPISPNRKQVSPSQCHFVRKSSPTASTSRSQNPSSPHMKVSLSNSELIELKRDKYIQKLTEEVCELTQRLSEQRLIILQLQIQLKEKDDLSLNFTVGERDGEIQELKKVIRMKESEFQYQLQKNIESREEIKQLKARLQETEREHSQIKASNMKLTKQYSSEMARMSTVKQENEKIRSQYETLVNNIRSVDAVDAPTKNASPTRAYKQVFQSTNKSNLQKDNYQLNQRLHQSDQNLDNVQKALQRKEAEYNQLSKAFQEKIVNLEKQLAHYRKRVDELTLIVESNDLQAVISDLQKKLTASKVQLEQQRKAADELAKQKDSELVQLRGQLGDTRQALESECDRLRLECEESQKRVHELEVLRPKASQSAFEEQSPLRKQQQQQQQSLQVERGSMKELQSKLRNSLHINKELEEQLTMFNKGDHSKDMQIYTLKESNKSLLNQVQLQENQINALKEELAEHEAMQAQRLSDVGAISMQLERAQLEMQKEIDRINEEKFKLRDDYILEIKELNERNQHSLTESQRLKDLKDELETRLHIAEAREMQQQFEKQILNLQEEKQQSEKLAQKQIQLLNRKISELQDQMSKNTLQLQKTKGSRRTSQLVTDHQTLQLQQKELKIQQLQKNLIETKQAYEALVEKAKQMNEKNKQLKDKMSKAHKLVKKDDEEQKDGQEPQPTFLWDLTMTNEFENLSSLTDKGWEFAKGSAVPMKPFIRSVFAFSFHGDLLVGLLNSFVKQFLSDQINASDLITAQAFVKVLEDTCVLTKIVNASMVPGMTMHKGSTNVYDQLDSQLWDEVWIDYAQMQCDCMVFVVRDLSYQEEEVINSLIRMNPANFILVVKPGERSEGIMSYLSTKFGLTKHESCFTNNRVTLVGLQEQEFINQSMLRSKNEEERLFLDTFKQFLQRNASKLFEDQGKPQIKIQKLLASNTFNYTVQLRESKLNASRTPIIINTMAPLVQVSLEGDHCCITIQLKGKRVTSVKSQAQQLSKHPKICSSQVSMQLTFVDTKFGDVEQQVQYTTQLPFLLDSEVMAECGGNGGCRLRARVAE